MAADYDFNKLSSSAIDDILDEIEQREPKDGNNTIKDESNANWIEILENVTNGNINCIKNLITSNDIDINAQNPINGKTLLIYSVIIGNYDLVKVICNFGADVKIIDKDEFDALDYATKYGRYKITELLYYRTLSGSLGRDLQDIATQIHEKNTQAMAIKTVQIGSKHAGDDIRTFIIKAIQQRLPFSSDLLYYAWYFTINADSTRSQQPSPLKSWLWREMMKTFESILCDTSDKEGWDWLKTYFVNSLIWYLPHPDHQDIDDDDGDDHDDADDMETILRRTLFYELLIKIRAESKKQSDLLLRDKINKIQREKPSDWNQLISYNAKTKYSSNARQDICKCLIPKYTEFDLSEEKYPPSTHFSAKKHYDTNIYLNELIFRANILDNTFQKDMKRITKEICVETGDDVQYRAGPVKTLTRSQTKVENDYINEDYPTSAKILDINRCALQCGSINDMMKYIKMFTVKIKNNLTYSIVDIIRCKNGWSVYNPQYPQYTDIKLNS